MDISVPSAEEAQDTDRQTGEIIVNVREDGSIILNGRNVNQTELLAKLQAILGTCQLPSNRKLDRRPAPRAPMRSTSKKVSLEATVLQTTKAKQGGTAFVGIGLAVIQGSGL